MNSKILALLLLVVMTFSLASCSFLDKIFSGKKPEVTTTVTTTVVNDPLRTEPSKVPAEDPQPANPEEWSDLIN